MSNWQEVELLKTAITSAEAFDRLVAELSRADEPPGALLTAIHACVRQQFGPDAHLRRHGSAFKGTQTRRSNFDYHVVTPSRTSVTKPQMKQLGHPLPAYF